MIEELQLGLQVHLRIVIVKLKIWICEQSSAERRCRHYQDLLAAVTMMPKI